jgi:hypothetical protein
MLEEGQRADAPYIAVPRPAPAPGNRHVMRLYLLIWLAIRSPTFRMNPSIIPLWEFEGKHIERVRSHIEKLLANYKEQPSYRDEASEAWVKYLRKALRLLPTPDRHQRPYLVA